jgi:hypothetical protein
LTRNTLDNRIGERTMPGIPVYAAAALAGIGLLANPLSPAWGFGLSAQEERGGQALAVAPATVTEQLYPGATGDVVYRVTNTNSVPVRVDATLSRVTGTDSAGCPARHFTVKSGGVTPVTIPAGQTATVTVIGGVTMDLDAPDACQGVTVTVPGKVFGTTIVTGPR